MFLLKSNVPEMEKQCLVCHSLWILLKVCNHVIAVYSKNKLQDYTTAYRHQKSSGEMLVLVIYIFLLNLVNSDEYF